MLTLPRNRPIVYRLFGLFLSWMIFGARETEARELCPACELDARTATAELISSPRTGGGGPKIRGGPGRSGVDGATLSARIEPEGGRGWGLGVQLRVSGGRLGGGKGGGLGRGNPVPKRGRGGCDFEGRRRQTTQRHEIVMSTTFSGSLTCQCLPRTSRSRGRN